MLPTDELVKEYNAIKVMLGVMDNISNRLESSEKVEPKHLEQIVKFLQVFADKCHHGKEEDLLFPAMIEAGVPSEGGPIAVILDEHKMGRNYIKKMSNAIADYRKGTGSAEIVENARGYIPLLTQHINKEDNVLYPMANQWLSEQKQKELLEGFEDVEHNIIGEGRHEEFHKLLHSLKEEYP